MAEIFYGIHEYDGKVISISDILNLPAPDTMRGARCRCLCPNPQCQKPLLAKLGRGVENGGKEPHFSHFPDLEGSCNSAHANESALHMMAKEIIAEEKIFSAPNVEITWTDAKINTLPLIPLSEIPTYIHPIGGVFECSKVSLEKRLSGIVPDIVTYSPFGECLIEISVTHPVTVEKKAKTVELQIPMLEIDLSDFKNKPISKQTLREILLNSTERMHWVYYNDQEQIFLQARDYYQNHPIVLTYIERERKREETLKREYEETRAKEHARRIAYNQKSYRSWSKSSNNVVNKTNYNEYLQRGLAFYREQKDHKDDK